MIYFIGNKQEGKVKIGYTVHRIKQRFLTVQTNCPFEVELLLTLDGLKDTEKHIHDMFIKDCIRGEWFTLSPDLQAFIDNPPPLNVVETFKFTPRVDRIAKYDTQIENMYSEGKSCQKIADALGYTYAQVRRYITRHGLHKKYNRDHPKMSTYARTPRKLTNPLFYS